MSDDLRHRYAEAILARLGQTGPTPSDYDLADAVMAVRDEELERLRKQVADYENAIARVRDLHHIHRCSVDGHVLASTRNPCVNDGMCRGCHAPEPCETLAAVDGDTEETETREQPRRRTGRDRRVPRRLRGF